MGVIASAVALLSSRQVAVCPDGVGEGGPSGMTDDSVFRILAGEHLPDGVASEIEFLKFFRHLLRASDDDTGANGTDVRVVCWLAPGSVRHHIVVRDSCTGHMCCRVEIALAMEVVPLDLDSHADHLSRLLTAALNLARLQEPPEDDA